MIAASLALFLPAAHGALPAGITQVATVEGISEYRLDNGLRVVLFPDAGSPSTSVNVTYLVGSRHESYGETGMAHLLEHLVFKGTPTSGNLWDDMNRRGMRFNGSTWFDRTNYFETFNASPADLEWALSMEADRMVNSRIDRKDLDSEMTVVRNEMERGENNPSRIVFQNMLSSAYRWHNYGKSTIGARSDVEGVDIERLRAFYRTYYQPDNAVVVIAGALRSRPDPVVDRQLFRRDPQAGAGAAAALHAGAGAGRRAIGHRPARGGSGRFSASHTTR
jgi:zinc protease